MPEAQTLEYFEAGNRGGSIVGTNAQDARHELGRILRTKRQEQNILASKPLATAYVAPPWRDRIQLVAAHSVEVCQFPFCNAPIH